MNNTVPTENPQDTTLIDALSETASSWLPWAGATVATAAVVYTVVRLRRSGRLSLLMSQIRRLLAKRDSQTDKSPTAPLAEGRSLFTPTRIMVAAAAVPSVLSLVWLATTVAEITGGLAGLAAGIFADVVIVSTVAVGWFNPAVRSLAGRGGWVAAVAASGLLAWHHWGTEEVAFALVPIGAKFLWHLALVALTAKEKQEAVREEQRLAREAEKKEKEAEAARLAEEEARRVELELSEELTFEQRRTIAERKRKAAYEKQLAEADREVDAAKKDTEHQRKLAEIRLLAEQQRAMDEESANVEIARQELIRKVNAGKPAAFALSSGEVPNDLSSLPPSPGVSQVMGFGSAMGSDQRTSPGRPVDPQLVELMTYIASAGSGASVRGAARELKVSAPTIRRWREKAEAQGLDVSALKSTNK